MSFEEEFKINIKANIPVFQICTYEWERLHHICISTAKAEKKSFIVWTSIGGAKKWNFEDKKFESLDGNCDPADILDWFKSEDQSELILLLEDFHPYLNEESGNATILRRIRECTRINSDKKKTLVIQTLSFYSPKDLEKEVPILELPLPNADDLGKILDVVVEGLDYDNRPRVDSKERDEIINASIGLSCTEAEWTYRKIIAEKGRLLNTEIKKIVEAKESIIKKSGILEYFHPDSDLENIGGLNHLKNWLQNRGKAFSSDAKKYGLPTPKGVLLLGIPGCGKSLTAKTIANEWNLPLLKFDLGKVFAGVVGESESNIRKALSLAEAIAPSILWIDEIEKGLSGIGSNGDSGTSSRVFGTLLTWMQEKKSEVFVIATANNIEQIPVELLRKGRFDEIFFVDLPNMEERKDIFKIHIHKKHRDIKSFNLHDLAEASVGFSGAEIAEAVNEALFIAYNDNRELSQADIKKALSETWPLSRTMQESITKLRKWAQARTKLASDPNTESIKEDENIPKLSQERRNIFGD